MNTFFTLVSASTMALLPASAIGKSYAAGSLIGGGNTLSSSVNVPSGLGQTPTANIPNQNSIGNQNQNPNNQQANNPPNQGAGNTPATTSSNPQITNTRPTSTSSRPRGNDTNDGRSALPRIPTVLSDDATDDVTAQIAIANEICSWFPLEVRIDCIADRFSEIARSIPADSEYAPVRAALEEAADELRAVSGRYASAGAPRKRYQAPHPVDGAPVKTSRLTSVTPDLQAQAFGDALRIVEELETKLLRSSENSQKRQIHYQEISASIGSTKVLLRSA